MKVYILVREDEDGEATFDMPVHFGRSVRAYSSPGMARAMAKKFNCVAIALDVEQGEEI